MVGQHQPVPLGSEPNQRKANERGIRQVEALGALLRQHGGHALRMLGFVQRRETDAVPKAPSPAAG